MFVDKAAWPMPEACEYKEPPTRTAASGDSARNGPRSKAPDGLFCHPRAEHLIPLMVAAGAAGADAGTTAWTGAMAGLKISAHHFGV